MAEPVSRTRTNYFLVKDEDAFRNLNTASVAMAQSMLENIHWKTQMEY